MSTLKPYRRGKRRRVASGANKVFLLGRIQGPVQMAKEKHSYALFSLLTEQVVQNFRGEYEMDQQVHRVVAWDQLAENCEGFLKDGATVFIEGRVYSRQWEDENGVMQRVVEILATHIQELN